MRGRFAPTPSGDLHLGSLLTALASYAQAKASASEWLLRLEDTDQPRNVSSAYHSIPADLSAFGLHADGEVVHQLDRQAAYAAALAQLQSQGLVYGCRCTRQQLQGHSIYPGWCRDLGLPLTGHAVRLRVLDQTIEFEDQIQGSYAQALAADMGDFVLRRRDGIWSYQLAVVVDDAAQQIEEVIRGYDLLDNTPRQIYLQHCLNLPTPRYGHVPLLCYQDGQKLSKQNLALPARHFSYSKLWPWLWQQLGQIMPDTYTDWSVHTWVNWAQAHWQLNRVPRQAYRLTRQTPDRQVDE